jgi:LPXTG-site transpeptidase (sortase) family protein
VPASEVRPIRLSIPALQVEANIIDLGLQANGTMQVPPDAKDAGWYVNSPAPGRPGPSVLAAHVNWKGEDGPFARLHELKAGDEVIVEDAAGAQAKFAVDRVETHDKNAFPAEEVYADTDGPELRLVTCGGDFDAAAHSYKENVIAFAKLVT